jgi:hypothetical protein
VEPLLTPGYFVRVRVEGSARTQAALVDDKVINSSRA